MCEKCFSGLCECTIGLIELWCKVGAMCFVFFGMPAMMVILFLIFNGMMTSDTVTYVFVIIIALITIVLWIVMVYFTCIKFAFKKYKIKSF